MPELGSVTTCQWSNGGKFLNFSSSHRLHGSNLPNLSVLREGNEM